MFAVFLMFREKVEMSHNPKLSKQNDIHGERPVPDPSIVSSDDWYKARQELLAAEKDVTRAYDAMVKKRRELPWTKVEKDYELEDPLTGEKTSLFNIVKAKEEGQEKPLALVVQHFMWPDGWDKGCASCSLWVDSINAVKAQLEGRAKYIVVIHREDKASLKDFVKVKGWDYPVYNCAGTTFAADTDCYQDAAALEEGKPMRYNFKEGPNPFGLTHLPGVSVFAVAPDGSVCKTYAVHGRGLEHLIGYWAFMDLLPEGRQGRVSVPHREEVTSRKRPRE